MLFTVRNNAFGENSLKNIKIVKNQKYGIMNESTNTYILPEEYDNIFLYGINIFALYQNGKIGLCKVENENVDIICECEYDVVDNYNHDLFLSNDNKTCYFNSTTQQTMCFKEVSVDGSYLYVCDENYQYIIKQETGQVIHKKKYTDYSKSCYVYCGESKQGAVFYDTRYSTYMYPTDKGYRQHENPLNHPVIVNRQNVTNIMYGEKGVYLIDSLGNRIIENEYNSVKIELKITAINDNEKIEKIIPIPNNVFEIGKVTDIENWI